MRITGSSRDFVHHSLTFIRSVNARATYHPTELAHECCTNWMRRYRENSVLLNIRVYGDALDANVVSGERAESEIEFMPERSGAESGSGGGGSHRGGFGVAGAGAQSGAGNSKKTAGAKKSTCGPKKR